MKSRPGFIFFSDMFWRCFKQGVDAEKLGYERDDENKGWWAPEQDIYKDKFHKEPGFEEPKDKISQEGLDTGVKRK